jgi:2-polyprenyl-6-methoxyphenol hydroxylase-like FAD-dependent oxidoreductase
MDQPPSPISDNSSDPTNSTSNFLNQKMADPSTEILIIGAGPTGLTLALELSIHRIPFRIIDSLAARSQYSRALAFQPRSLELLAKHGVTEKLISRGRFNEAIRIFVAKKFVYEIDIQNIGYEDTRIKTPLMISQANTEEIMEEKLNEYGTAAVERGVTLEKLEEDSAGVTALLRNANGEKEEVKVRYVIGCDGAHSIVRKQASLRFEGGAYEQDFILADVKLEWDGRMCLSFFMGAWGSLLIFPLPSGSARLVVMRSSKSNPEAEPTLADFEEAFKQLVPFPSSLSSPTWLANFHLHHRLASSFRSPSGRIFLAGDAAHIHSPAGGQGMNTGIQDSINLGWKLAAVLRNPGNENNEVLLNSYDKERRKVGENLLKGTDKLFEMMATTSPIYLWLRNLLLPWILPWLLSNRERRANRFRFVSQLGIRYRDSPIVGMATGYEGGLRGGDRAPDGRLGRGREEEIWVHGLLTGPGFHLLLFSGLGEGGIREEQKKAVAQLLDGNEGWVRGHRIFRDDGNEDRNQGEQEAFWDPEGKVHSLYGFKDSAGCVLVRPDGYISYIGPLTAVGLKELREWVKMTFLM